AGWVAAGHAAALRPRPRDRAQAADAGPAPLHRADGEPVPGLREAAAEGPQRDRAAVRQLDQLGRRAERPAGVGADPPARATPGPSPNGSPPAPNRPANHHISPLVQ